MMPPYSQNGKIGSQVSKKEEEKTETNRRRRLARRLYSYAQHIPERRSGEERRNNAQDHHDQCATDSQYDLHGSVPDEEIAEQNSSTRHPIEKETP
jgi:hypothetical protein